MQKGRLRSNYDPLDLLWTPQGPRRATFFQKKSHLFRKIFLEWNRTGTLGGRTLAKKNSGGTLGGRTILKKNSKWNSWKGGGCCEGAVVVRGGLVG